MSRCSSIFRHIYNSDCKTIMIKVEKEALLALPKAEISFLSNFQKICIYFLIYGFSFYGNSLS